MKYLKFKDDSKARCLEALDQLNSDERFQYLRENMIDHTVSESRKTCVDMSADNVELPPLQGVARVLDELSDLSRGAHKVRGLHNKR